VQKRHYFIITLMMALAVIVGSTLGIASNLQLIVERANHINQQNNNQKSNLLSEKTSSSENQNITDSSINLSAIKPANSSDSSMDLLASDQAEIEKMLRTLIDSSQDFQTDLINYQKSHSLHPTGQLDYETLDRMIYEAKVKRAAELARLN